MQWEYGRRILSVSSTQEDHDSLCHILNDPGWLITGVFSCQQAVSYLCRERSAIIICACHVPDGTWRDILSHIAELTDPPLVIVTAEAAEESLRAEVHALGGYDVLAKPFVAEEVSHMLSAAWKQRASVLEPVPA